jgi:hypothetical protein
MNNKNLIRVLFLTVCVLAIAKTSAAGAARRKLRKPSSPMEKYEGKYDEYDGEVMSNMKEGDIRVVAAMDSRQKSKKEGRSLGLNDWWLWPNGVIPYTWGSYFTRTEKNTIRAAMDMITAKTGNCITFRAADTSKDLEWLNIINDNGCWSYVGSAFWGAQDLSLSRTGCVYKGTAVHEFLHAIGMFHEHTRPDRDNYIRIDQSRIIPGYEDQFTINTGYDTYSTPYDYYSIMHYGASSFANDYVSQTIFPLQPGVTLLNSYEKTDDQILTASDVRGIQVRYGCPLTAPTTPAPTTTPTTTTPAPTTPPTTTTPTTTTPAPTTPAPTTPAPTTQAQCDSGPSSAEYDALQASITALQTTLNTMQGQLTAMRA